ncbi:hypothetical protein AAG906_031649 [Vitis piasezkii]
MISAILALQSKNPIEDMQHGNAGTLSLMTVEELVVQLCKQGQFSAKLAWVAMACSMLPCLELKLRGIIHSLIPKPNSIEIGFHDQVILQLQSLTHRQTKIDPTPSIQLLRGFPSHNYLISRFSSQVSYDHQELIKVASSIGVKKQKTTAI